MTDDPTIARRKVEIKLADGFHMRPAGKFVVLANTFKDNDIQIRHKGELFNGKSLLELTMLAAECGTWLELEVRGPEAETAVDALAQLVSSLVDEPAESPGESAS